MPSLLKEALKLLCGDNRWSYAVFWKFGCQNPTLLIWDDYHYQPAQPTQKSILSEIAGVDSTELLLKEWEGLWSAHESRFPHLGGHPENKVCSLINRMMFNNHVHVVGEGIVGRAAFTGNHQWILQQNCMDKGYPSEVLTEVHHQFLAGMQTVTAIPVLPHGVVQLGSTLAIAENMEFVNNVKSLFAQLGGGVASIPSNYTTEKKAGASSAIVLPNPSAIVLPNPTDTYRNSCSQAATVTPSISRSCKKEISTTQAPEPLGQLADSVIAQTQNCMPAYSATQQTSSLSSVGSLFQINSHPVTNPGVPLRGHLESGTVTAQVILSKTETQLKQRASVYNSNSKFNDQLVQSGSSSTNMKFIEQQIMSTAGLQERVNSVLPAINNTLTSQLRTGGGTTSNLVNDSVIVSLLGRNQPPNDRHGVQTLTSITSSRPISLGSEESSSASLTLTGLPISSSNTGVIQVSSYGDLINNSSVLPLIPEQSYMSTNDDTAHIGLTKGKQVMENDMFRAPRTSYAQSDDQIPRCAPMNDFLRDGPVSNLKYDKENPRLPNVISEDSCELPLPPGDDLFDILGLGSKNRNSYATWNMHGADVNMSNMSMDASTCITQTDANHQFYAVDDGISESGVLNSTGSDHLLDAVVSKVHSSAKQNSGEDISCWKVSTNNSSSAPVSGQMNLSDQKQVKFCGFPPPRAQSQITGSSSFRSGSSKDSLGGASQIDSVCRSQISLLSEDDQAMKCDNSIPTAYSKKPDETGKSNRKRLRPGENPRPRPKDRQMIQDRMKELREIVPNGAKCSIDALLERTIKHMLFLQSVTKHAEKLKHAGESKFISKDGGLFLKDKFEGGATWGIEVGSQAMVCCPIIVEDLNPPRQMLVEMLCEEQGFFLEIADIIRGMGLTILKGVMEARNEKVWVRFTVEANRDVTRMEIFMSLVHLLEQVNINAASSKSADEENLMAQNALCQTTVPLSIPSATFQ